MPYRVILRGLPLALLLLWLLPLWAAEPIQSPNDPRAYQSLTLDNRLQVLLVSDPETDKAAAALALEVGSIDDPPDHLGLAHFLEHMLFLGTEKYPEPGEYKDFLAAHGGSHNAYTAYEHTNYFFEVDADHLEPALDRFAQFFIAPLFTPRYVDNERQVVHSEYQSKLGSDGWRIRSAQQQALNPEHPASRFSVGSRETLADRPEAPIRETLIRFYRTHYSANLMKLVVLGKEPLPVLRRWVEARFAAVADHDAAPRLVDVPMFRDDQLPARLAVQSLEDERNLTLTFPLPPQRDAYRSKPAGYVAHLLGHEGEGSLLARLKQLGWASGLWAGLSADNRSEASFSVSIRLTEAGLEQADAIIERVFQARQLIERDGIEAWRYAEQRRLAEIDFRFQERGSAGAHARRLAANLLQYPVREVLRGPYLMEDFDPQAIRDLLARLTPDNLLVTLSAPVLDTDAVDPWFQVPYRLEPVATETLNAWRDPEPEPQLALPEPNPYIPERLVLRDLPPQPSAEPRLIRRRPGLALWHQQAVDFRVPRAEYYFSVRSPRANDSAAHAVLTELYVRSVEEQLSDELYPAALAGLNARLYRHMRGFTVRLSGYDEKQGLLLERIVATLREPAFEPERFARLVETLAAELRNAAQAPPYRQALHEIPDLLLDPSWTDAQRLEVLEDLDVADLRAFVPQLLARLELVVLAYGNLGTERAEAMTRTLESGLLAAAEPTSVPRGRLLQLSGDAPRLRRLEVDNNDSAVAIYFQGPGRELTTRARYGLLAEALESPFFETLRTEQRLGYVVFASPLSLLEVPGLALVVQSPDTPPRELERRIDGFLRDHAGTLAELEPARLSRLKDSLRSRVLSRDTSLRDRADYYWTELDRDEPRFDTRQRLAEVIAGIDREQLVTTYRETLLSPARRLAVYSLGEGTVVEGEALSHALIDDPVQFRAALEPVPEGS